MSSSTRRRCSGSSQMLSRTMTVACASEIRPRVRAVSVCGISWTRARAMPMCRPPRWADSRRASATSAPSPRQRSRRAMPRSPLGCGAQRAETGRERRLGSGGGGLELLERANGLEAGGLVLRKVGGGQLPDDVDDVVGAQGPAAQIRCASEARGGWPIRSQRLIQMRDARRICTGLAQGGGLRPAPRPRPARHRPLIHDPHATKGPGQVKRAARNCGGAVGAVPAPCPCRLTRPRLTS